jgi:hypothetical protein
MFGDNVNVAIRFAIGYAVTVVAGSRRSRSTRSAAV